jgi:hypothetical protein
VCITSTRHRAHWRLVGSLLHLPVLLFYSVNLLLWFIIIGGITAIDTAMDTVVISITIFDIDIYL